MLKYAIRCRNSISVAIYFPRNENITVKQNSQTKNGVSRYSTKVENGPLSGIRILDFSRVLAAPFATMILGDLGAEIIKVERPDGGDETRSWGPPFIGEESCYFMSVNRNKKSIVVDMKSTRGVEILKELASKSDILVENFLPDVMSKVGLGYDSLKLIAPRLIYCSLTGYGSSGPYRNKPGYDVLAASIGGLIDVTGPEDGEPCKVGVAMTDLATGLYLHGAIMAALMHRTSTGKGQKIDCDLLSTQISCMVNLASAYLNGGMVAKRYGTAHQSIIPYQAFKTKEDEYISIGAGNKKAFDSLCKTLEIEELLSDENYLTNSARVKNKESLLKILTEKFKTKTLKEWLDLFCDATFPYAPINTIKQAFEDPQVIHNNLVNEVDHVAGKVKLINPAVTYSCLTNEIRSSPPVLGEHTIEILKDILGKSSSDIENLRESGVVQCS